MAKYADIEPFYDWLTELMRMDTSSYPDHQTLMLYEIMDGLDSLPEVVRCKDCKHCKKYRNKLDPMLNRQLCVRMDTYGWGVEEDDFCSKGERREGE